MRCNKQRSRKRSSTHTNHDTPLEQTPQTTSPPANILTLAYYLLLPFDSCHHHQTLDTSTHETTIEHSRFLPTTFSHATHCHKHLSLCQRPVQPLSLFSPPRHAFTTKPPAFSTLAFQGLSPQQRSGKFCILDLLSHWRIKETRTPCLPNRRCILSLFLYLFLSYNSAHAFGIPHVGSVTFSVLRPEASFALEKNKGNGNG